MGRQHLTPTCVQGCCRGDLVSVDFHPCGNLRVVLAVRRLQIFLHIFLIDDEHFAHILRPWRPFVFQDVASVRNIQLQGGRPGAVRVGPIVVIDRLLDVADRLVGYHNTKMF